MKIVRLNKEKRKAILEALLDVEEHMKALVEEGSLDRRGE